MLYISTRNSHETYTAARVLSETRAPDGGLFAPYYTAPFPKEELDKLGTMKFNDTVARLMNIQFQTQISGHDVRLCVGRSPVRIASLSNRIMAGECWHNLRGSYDRLVENLTRHICADAAVGSGSWARVGIGACVLFGIFGELLAAGAVECEKKADVSVVGGDFSMVMSCVYARAWGLPIGNIIICCNENNAVWNLFSNGVLRTDGISIPTAAPDADVSLPDSLERLIHSCAGSEEVLKYLDRCRMGANYYPEDALLEKLRSGIYVSVVSSRRMLDTIPNVYSTHGYLLSPCSALAYAGLMDYRAKRGGGRPGLILAEHSPRSRCATVAECLGMAPEELETQLG